MDFKDKSELFDYLTSLEERLAELEKPKDEPAPEDGKPTDENKNEDDSSDIDEIEKLLED